MPLCVFFFFPCHLVGENTSRWHERKKTMTGSHFRLKNTGISSEELSMWQSCLLQRSVRTWWIPAGSTSVCKSLSLKILIISLESKSLIMTSQWIAAVKLPHWHQNTIHSDVQHEDAFPKKTNAGVNKGHIYRCSFHLHWDTVNPWQSHRMTIQNK